MRTVPTGRTSHEIREIGQRTHCTACAQPGERNDAFARPARDGKRAGRLVLSPVAFITPGPDVGNEWLEPVTDEVYGALPTGAQRSA